MTISKRALFVIVCFFAVTAGAFALYKIYREQSARSLSYFWSLNPVLIDERIEFLNSLILKSPDKLLVIERMQLADIYINNGMTRAAVAQLEIIKNLIESSPSNKVEPELVDEINFRLGEAYFRIAEEENCITHHNKDSCIFPIQKGAVHHFTSGAKSALKLYESELEKNPNQIEYLWLKNLANSVLGTDLKLLGAKFHADYLQTKKELKNQLLRFPDVSSDLGFNISGWAAGGIFEDFNNDGFIDIFASGYEREITLADRYRREPVALYLNNGHGEFINATENWGIAETLSGLYMIQTDFNNDGFADVLIVRGGWSFTFDEKKQGFPFPMTLLKNENGKKFIDVTKQAGLDLLGPSQVAAWSDVNNDGFLDLFVGYESYNGSNYPSALFINNTNGTFTNLAKSAGLDFIGVVKGATFGDYDNNGTQDLYVSFADQKNRLLKNITKSKAVPIDVKFVDVSDPAKVNLQESSFATWFWDYNNDGWLDLISFGNTIPFLTNSDRKTILRESIKQYYDQPNTRFLPKLYRNDGNGHFADKTADSGFNKSLLVMGSNYGDFDNDGFVDFYGGTGTPYLSTLSPNVAYRNKDGEYFQDITFLSGLGHLQKGHSVAFGDIDNNGSQDILAIMGGAFFTDHFRRALFENQNLKNNWIKLFLQGQQTNRPAIGARLEIEITTDQGPRKIYSTVSTGSSFGANPFRREIGLGLAKKINKLTIYWPTTQLTQIFTDLEVNSSYKIIEGEEKLKKVTLDSWK